MHVRAGAGLEVVQIGQIEACCSDGGGDGDGDCGGQEARGGD